MIAELELALSKGDIGTPCAEPAPSCGNGAIEGTEQCDDADADDGDGCKATCELGEVAASAPPPEKKDPVVPPAPPPTPQEGGLGTVGIIVGASGAVLGTGLTVVGFVLDGELQKTGGQVEPATKETYLSLGWPIAIGAGVGFAAAAAGAVLFVMD